MTNATKSEITIPNDSASANISGLYYAVAPRNQAVGYHPTEPDQLTPAEHNNFCGFLQRAVALTPTSEAERYTGRVSATLDVIEPPYKVGDYVSARKADEIEVEGADYIWLSGTGAVASNTTIPQSMSLLNGRWRKTQSGEVVNGFLAANNLTPCEEGALRIRIRVQN